MFLRRASGRVVLRALACALFAACLVAPSTDSAAQAFGQDATPLEEIARKMIQMTMDLNKTLEAVGTPAADGAPKVTCFTCHRGAAKPLTAPAAGGF